MRLAIALLVLLTGCQKELDAAGVADVFVDSINTGNFQPLDSVTGAAFIEERVVRCDVMNSVVGAEEKPCDPTSVVRRWDEFVRELHEHMAPCRRGPLSKDVYWTALIECGSHRDRFQLKQDSDGWRLSGDFENSLLSLHKALVLEQMRAEVSP